MAAIRTQRPMRWLWAPGAAVALSVAGLWSLQDRLIYQPPSPRPAAVAAARSVGRDVKSTITSGGRTLAQVSFYIPAEQQPARRLWLVFHGNGSLATDWLDLAAKLRSVKPEGVDVLLVEYPGYGLSAGKPSPETIRAASDAAFAELARMLGEQPGDLARRTGVMGHSLGCAAALQFAASHDVREVILVAPFTSLKDMARVRVGWPLCRLLQSNFDNRGRLREAMARRSAPKVTILHGSRDRIVPQRMGRELAHSNTSIRFISLEGAGHGDIPHDGPDGLVALMTGG